MCSRHDYSVVGSPTEFEYTEPFLRLKYDSVSGQLVAVASFARPSISAVADGSLGGGSDMLRHTYMFHSARNKGNQARPVAVARTEASSRRKPGLDQHY
jgi:hypothetical protein